MFKTKKKEKKLNNLFFFSWRTEETTHQTKTFPMVLCHSFLALIPSGTVNLHK